MKWLKKENILVDQERYQNNKMENSYAFKRENVQQKDRSK